MKSLYAGRRCSIFKLLVIIVFISAIGLSPSSAQQTNPDRAACCLPAEGTVWIAITYTLTADCTQTGELRISTDVTIVGGGFTIDASALTGVDAFLFSFPVDSFTMSNLTLLGGGR